ASFCARTTAPWKGPRARAPAAVATRRRSGPKPTCFWRACTTRSRASPTTTPSSPSSARLVRLDLQLLRLHRPLHPGTLQESLRRRAHLRADIEPELAGPQREHQRVAVGDREGLAEHVRPLEPGVELVEVPLHELELVGVVLVAE